MCRLVTWPGPTSSGGAPRLDHAGSPGSSATALVSILVRCQVVAPGCHGEGEAAWARTHERVDQWLALRLARPGQNDHQSSVDGRFGVDAPLDSSELEQAPSLPSRGQRVPERRAARRRCREDENQPLGCVLST